MGLGLGEVIVLVCILVFILSASQLSRLGNALGKFVYSFRKAAKGEDFVDVKPLPPSERRRHGRLPEAERADETRR
ncbi:MAG: twin-arginine translocase TatA/TatE family subunit [Myxococcaceae bacterium]|nr:twin-arginine translocase TatA/TatE family subunit [Myxococcaceae bacterium]MCI0670974.1 twin-arginine translocase TatA/TatE family subunit [Myxococcaceae bacterium]